MIHVFFVPGMFGSTIEYVLSDFTCELTPTNATIHSDGSMHGFRKQNHPLCSRELVRALCEINTPAYPFIDMQLPDILTQYPSSAKDCHILLFAPTVPAAELNMLFQYHKISVGRQLGLEIFYGGDQDAEQNVQQWNQHYKTYSDLQPWQFREWFSLYYPGWTRSWQISVNQVDNTWLKIPCTDILADTAATLRKIIKFCNLTEKNGLEKFAAQWRLAQQYVLDEFDLLDQIVCHSVANQSLEWKPINIIAEAIVQQRLRTLGLAIRCDGLNTFPCDAKTLYNLLEKV